MMNGWDMSGWGWFWMTLMMMGGLLAVVVLLMTLVRSSGKQGTSAADNPASILRRRLASGDITKQEYEDLTQLLTVGSGSKSSVGTSSTPSAKIREDDGVI